MSLKSTAKSGASAGKNFINQGWAAIPVWGKGLLLVGLGYGIYRLAKGAIGGSKLGPGRDTAQEVDGWNQTFIKDSKTAAPTKVNADYSGVNSAWGRRTISSGRLNPEPDLKNATLIQAIQSEMSGNEKTQINKILAKAGVKYRV